MFLEILIGFIQGSENAAALSVANLAENPLDLADFALIWRKIFAFGGQRIF